MKKLLVVWTLVCFLLPAPLSLFAQNGSPIRLTILHLNDLHGHLIPFIDKTLSETTPVGGAATLAAMIEDERARNPESTLLLSAGDMFQGTPISNVFLGQPVIEIMNALKFDAMALGNHEFDWGRDTLNHLTASARFPFLSANVLGTSGPPLEGIKPYVILPRKDLKVAVIGVTTTETGFTTKPGNVTGLEFADPIALLPNIIREAREGGAQFIVVLSHAGLDADQEIARGVPGIDVIVGGHSHAVVTDPLRVNGTIIVQAGSYGIYLGVLDLQIDPATHHVFDYSARKELKTVLSGPDAKKDEQVSHIVGQYEDRIKAEFSRVVGETSVDLTRQPSEESNFGDLICDAMKESSGAEIAFQNSGGIRADLPRGSITLEAVYTALPFDNTLAVMNLSGDQIREILEQNAAMESKILQVSGIRVVYDLKKPLGSRLIEATSDSGTLLPQKIYRVVTNDFLAAGGDRFSVFKEGTDLHWGDTVRDAFVSYLRKHSPVHPQVEHRIDLIP